MEKITMTIPPTYNAEAELAMCSPEVRAACQAMGSYMAGTPTQMELAFQLRQLNQWLTAR